MALRFLFRYSQAGCLCKPINLKKITNKYILRKGNFTNLQEKYKYKIFYVPLRYNSTKKYSDPPVKYFSFKQLKQLQATKVDEEDDYGDYYQKMDEINYGAYFSRKHNYNTFKKRLPRTRNRIFKFCTQANFYEMETFFNEMKRIDDGMKSSWTFTPSEIVIREPMQEMPQILQDIDLDVKDDVWPESCPEILNNLNCKNDVWKLICGNRNGMKHETMENISSDELWKSFIQPVEMYEEDNRSLKSIK